MSRSHLILAERIGIEVICSHGHELPNNCCLPWPATTAPFPGSRAMTAACAAPIWSPERMAGRLRLDYPEDQGMRISGRPSARWISAAALPGDAGSSHLRRAHRCRRWQGRCGRGKAACPGVSI